MTLSAHSLLMMTDGCPERRLESGERLFSVHDTDHSTVVVLVDGRLRVDAGGTRLPDVTVPGSFVGEVGALLGRARTANVTAIEATTVRTIGDPETFFTSHPLLALELARQLAGRLHRLTAYLADVRTQYAESDGHLGMVDAVLGRLAARTPVEVDGGSDRSPDY